jgi:hypothetical protein
MRIKSFTAALALPTMKVNTDSQPTTKRNNELVLLRRIIAESKCFRRPATETTSSRHGCSDSAALLAAMAVLGQVKGNGVAVLPEGYSAADPAQDPKAAARLLSPPVTDVRKPQKERHGGADEKED